MKFLFSFFKHAAHHSGREFGPPVGDGNFTDEDMQNSLLSIINGVKGFNDSGYAMAMWYFAQKYDGESYSPEEEIERISAVTREDIIAAAKSMKLDTVYVLTGKGEQ